MLQWPEGKVQAFVQSGIEFTGLRADDCPLDIHPADVRMLEIAACNTDRIVVIREGLVATKKVNE